MCFRIRLAGMPIGVRAIYARTKRFCRDYLTEEAPGFEVEMTQGDIDTMRESSVQADLAEGREPFDYSDAYLECIALYKKIADRLLDRQIMMFHGSVVAVEEKAYLFMAKSGTGKTTHTRLWLKNIPNCHVLNGDKPLIRFDDAGVIACGTPWRGKENDGINEMLPLAGICLLERGETNVIERIPFKKALFALILGSYRPEGQAALMISLRLIARLVEMPLYRLCCNMEDAAAWVAYRGLSGLE